MKQGQSVKIETEVTTWTNTNCRKCQTHGGDYLVFEFSYPTGKSDSLKTEHLTVNVYENAGHNATNLTVKNFELSKTAEEYVLLIGYLDSKQRLKKKKITQAFPRSMVNQSW
jgi:hypothetical protein